LVKESGISNWRRAQALNTDETFIGDMAEAKPMAKLNSIENPSSSILILSKADKRLFGFGFRESPSGLRVYDHIRKAWRAF
jgi:hypothetical protein